MSGGHTFLVEMRDHLTYRLLGQTVDDAAGEAFDKVGRLLDLGYPGGPAIMKAAAGATTRDVVFPRAWLGDTYDFSFSGLKTAARRAVDARAGGDEGRDGRRRRDDGLPDDRRRRARLRLPGIRWSTCSSRRRSAPPRRPAPARSCWAAASPRTASCATGWPAKPEALGVPLVVPPPALCTDNGAMIGAAAARRFAAGERAGLDLDARPSLPLATRAA